MPLTQNKISLRYRQNQVSPQHERSQVRIRITTITIRPFRVVMAVVCSLTDKALHVVSYVKEQCVLPLVNEERAGGVHRSDDELAGKYTRTPDELSHLLGQIVKFDTIDGSDPDRARCDTMRPTYDFDFRLIQYFHGHGSHMYPFMIKGLETLWV